MKERTGDRFAMQERKEWGLASLASMDEADVFSLVHGAHETLATSSTSRTLIAPGGRLLKVAARQKKRVTSNTQPDQGET